MAVSSSYISTTILIGFPYIRSTLSVMSLLLILMSFVAAEDCYTESELYTGSTTRSECEPWSEAAWAWPEMSDKYSGSKNYCRLVAKNWQNHKTISGRKVPVSSHGATRTSARG